MDTSSDQSGSQSRLAPIPTPVAPVAVSRKKIGNSSFRWVIIGLAFFITLVNYLDRSAISYAAGPLKAEFALNDQQYGLIAGAFGIGYMVMTVGGGLLVDRWGSHKIWSLAALLWSLCTAMMGMANSYSALFMLRTMLGVAEGPHFPSFTRVVADWLPGEERARATALGLAAVPFASVIGAPLLSQLVVNLGWKAMFVVLGIAGTAWVAAWLLIYRDYPENCRFVSDGELQHIRGERVERNRTDSEIRQRAHAAGTTRWRDILLNPSLLANNYAFFAFGYLIFFAMTWLPDFLQETYHLKLKEVGIFLIAPWLTASILILFAGWLSDWLWKRTGSRRMARSHMIWICQLASGLCFIPLLFTHSLDLSIIMISLGLGLGCMPNAAFYALNCDLAPDRAATSIGVMDCFFAAAGIAAPAITGLIVNRTGSFVGAFGLLIFFTLTAVVAVLFLQKPDEKPAGAPVKATESAHS